MQHIEITYIVQIKYEKVADRECKALDIVPAILNNGIWSLEVKILIPKETQMNFNINLKSMLIRLMDQGCETWNLSSWISQ